MKKLLLSLLVLALVAPAMAVVNFGVVNNANGTATITINTNGDVVRGVALKVTCTGGAKLVDLSRTVNPAFNTFIDYFAVTGFGEVTGETPNQEGHPYSLTGAIAGVAAINDTTFGISMGVLDGTGAQGGFSSTTAANLITVKTGAGSVCLSLEADYRGGVVGDVALTTNLDSASVCQTITAAPTGPTCVDYNLTAKKGGGTDPLVNIDDVNYFVNYVLDNRPTSVFRVGPTAPGYDADYNFDTSSPLINIDDLNKMVNFVLDNRPTSVFRVNCTLCGC